MSFDFNDLNTNAGGSGLQGPFINWQAKAGQHAQGQNWTLRSKDADNSSRVDIITDRFTAGVVFDFHTIKLGWEKWAPMGQQNDVVWAPTLNLAAFPRPDDSKRNNEMGRSVFTWQKIFSVRVAIRPDLAGTWVQSAFGAVLGFEGFIDALKQQGPQHPGKLPLVRMTGVRDDFGGAKVPVLEIADWKDSPACLKQDTGAGAINTGPASALAQPVQQAPAQPQAAPAQPAAAVPEEIGF